MARTKLSPAARVVEFFRTEPLEAVEAVHGIVQTILRARRPSPAKVRKAKPSPATARTQAPDNPQPQV